MNKIDSLFKLPEMNCLQAIFCKKTSVYSFVMYYLAFFSQNI